MVPLKKLGFLGCLALALAVSSCAPDTPDDYFCCKPKEEKENLGRGGYGGVPTQPGPPTVQPRGPRIPPPVPRTRGTPALRRGTVVLPRGRGGGRGIPIVPIQLHQHVCLKDDFIQPHRTLVNDLDILFVTDTSGSLKDERLAAAHGILNFVDELPAHINYQIGVLLSHGSGSPWHKRLFVSRSNEEEILSSVRMDRDQIQDSLESKLTQVQLDYGTEKGSDYWNNIGADAGEAGLYALYHYLGEVSQNPSFVHPFVRKNAGLAVVFVADENDICSVYPGFSLYPSGIKPNPGYKGTETWFQNQGYCDGITPNSVLKILHSVKSELPSVVSGIVYNNHDYPKTGQNEYGYGYMDLIEKAKGISVDLAKVEDIPRGLGSIGRTMSRRINLISRHQLNHPDVLPGSIIVTVDGREVSFFYSDVINTVILDNPGLPGSLVEINYCLK